MQQTLMMIKPDAVERNLVGEILRRAEAAGLKILRLRMMHLTKEEACTFYKVHAERPFYGSLTDFMSSGPMVAAVLEGESAVDRWRETMGGTNPEEAAPGTIRKDLALNIEKNSVHGSDAPETAKEEISFFGLDLKLRS